MRRRAYLQSRGILVSSQPGGNLPTTGRSLDLLLNGVVGEGAAPAPASPAGSFAWPAGELAE